jgi:hypothetical protein
MTHSHENASDTGHAGTTDTDEVNSAKVGWNWLIEIWLNH